MSIWRAKTIIGMKDSQGRVIGVDVEKQMIEDLKDPQIAQGFLNALLDEEENPDDESRTQEFMYGLYLVIKAHGVSQVARQAGMNRSNIYHSIVNRRSTRVDKLVSVLSQVGLRLRVEPRQPLD
jgi:DNA-binding phage protein